MRMQCGVDEVSFNSLGLQALRPLTLSYTFG